MKRARDRGPVVIVDRDGTIVVDRHYLSDPAGLEFTAGAAEGLRQLYESGFRLVVATNQSGVGRGLVTPSQLDAVHAALVAMIRRVGADLSGIYVCPHTPFDACSCRKPEAGLLLRAARDLGFEPSTAIVVGDKPSDVEFGKRAGAAAILLTEGAASSSVGVNADFVARDFGEAAAWILNCGASTAAHESARVAEESVRDHG